MAGRRELSADLVVERATKQCGILAAMPSSTRKLEIGGRAKSIDRPVSNTTGALFLTTGLDAFYEHGYDGTTVRDIARRAGLTVAALYYHFSSKYALLVHIITRGMEDVISEMTAARDGKDDDLAGQLVCLVGAHVGYHTSRQKEAFIINTEIRSLLPPDRRRLVAQRDRVERMYLGVIESGVKAGIFRSTVDPREITRATIAMGIHVSQWYHDGPLTPDDIIVRYATLALDMVGFRGNVASAVVRARRNP